MNDRTPVSYATADEARAYVMRVLSRPPAKAPASVYVIASPTLYGSPAWPAIAEALDTLLPGAGLLTFNDVFPPGAVPAEVVREARAAALHPPVQQRVPRIAERVRGAVVIPRKSVPPGASSPRYLLGYAASLEAAGLFALGLPVLVFAPGGMLAWPDVRAHPAVEPHPSYATVELDVPPAPPQGVLLPTVAASYRALGLPRPRPRRPPKLASSAGARVTVR